MEKSIRIVGVSKGYKQYAGNKDRLIEWILPSKLERHKTKWVLKNLNFEVDKGEAVAIVGMNGAGKSTLLKIITGTTVPTQGHVELNGKVAALLELGMGFHPDFTGRQNVYMSGQLLGYSNEEISLHMQAIEDFAEIGAAIDEPVRTYSSGMQVRLAFSVATMVRPEILIIDEALSVGDSYFQHKSFARIKSFKEQGTTLLLVSHDKAAIQAICDKAFLLNHGNIIKAGNPEVVMNYYNAMLAEHSNLSIAEKRDVKGKVQTISGTGEAAVEKIYIANMDSKCLEVIDVGKQVSLCVEVKAKEDIPQLVLGVLIKDVRGQEIYGTNTFLEKKILQNVKSGEQYIFKFSFPMLLGIGKYSITTALTSTDTHLVDNYEWKDLAFVFEVINIEKPYFAGTVWLNPKICIEKSNGGI